MLLKVKLFLCLVNHFKILLTAVKNTKTVADNMQKFQNDRQYLQSVISMTLNEILTHQTFSSLINSVQQAHDQKAAMKQAILG